MSKGVSIVICCYNSAKRLAPTLSHLKLQQVQPEINWEVILLNNASTDNTSEVAQELWGHCQKVNLRIIDEPRKGLSYARHRGLKEAKYELVCFVDDDNWVCAEWVQTVAEIMYQHPQVAACGGCSKAVSDTDFPWWFELYQDSYAVGKQADSVGDVTQSRGFLWGAGLTIRKKAWEQLLDKGFQPLLTDRIGINLASCGDYELCLALRLIGWHLWYEPRLFFYHYLPPSRLIWDYLRRLKRGFGASSVGLDPYSYFLQTPNINHFSLTHYLKKIWLFRFILVSFKLLINCHILIINYYSPLEGKTEILEVEILKGRFMELVKSFNCYAIYFKQVNNIFMV